MPSNMQVALARIRTLEAQRAELLVSLEALVENSATLLKYIWSKSPNPRERADALAAHTALANARAAIARTKGGDNGR